MKLLITGGTGQVGKHLQDFLKHTSENTTVFLSSKDCNLLSESEVLDALALHKPDAVIHLAGKIGGISENIKYPSDYFYENIIMNSILIENSRKIGIKKFIAVLSTCAYPDVLDTSMYPMSEECLHMGPPTETNFGYGYAKRCMAVQIEAINKQFGLSYQYVLPPNLYGPYDKFDERSHYIGALMMKILKAKKSGETKIQLMGDGSPIRQFMYAEDLAKALTMLLTNDATCLNISPDLTLSIKEIAEIALKVCEVNMEIEWLGHNNGQYRKDVSNKKFKSIYPDFKFTSLEEGLKITWQYINK